MDNSCFICNKTSNRTVYKQNGFESRRCEECGLLYCNPLPNEGYVDFEKDSHNESFYKMSSNYKAKWLAEKAGPSKSILEIGPGNGYLLKELSNYGYHVAGLEPNRGRVENIRNHYNFEVYEGFLESFDFKEKKFEVIFHVDLLAHFPDPLKAIEKMKDAVKKDGYISFEVGVVGGISPFWYRFFPLGLPQHRWLYSEKSLEKLLGKAELTVLHRKIHSLAPYLIFRKLSSFILVTVLRRLLKPFVGKRVSVLFQLHNKFSNFLRYKVGQFFPNVGPLTIFYITKPL